MAVAVGASITKDRLFENSNTIRQQFRNAENWAYGHQSSGSADSNKQFKNHEKFLMVFSFSHGLKDIVLPWMFPTLQDQTCQAEHGA